jgi:hypothetical protein
VARYTARMMPILAVSIVFDGLQSVLSCELVHSPTSEAHFDLTHIIL